MALARFFQGLNKPKPAAAKAPAPVPAAPPPPAPAPDGMEAVAIAPSGFRARHALTGRWSLHAMNTVERYKARAYQDPVLNSMRIACDGAGDWVRLLYNLTDELHRGGSYTIVFDLSFQDDPKSKKKSALAWSAVAWDDDNGGVVVGQRFFTGMAASGQKTLRFDIPQLGPGRSYYFAFCVTSFPASFEIAGIHVIEHVLDDQPPSTAPPPAADTAEPAKSRPLVNLLKGLSPSDVAKPFWSGEAGFQKLRDVFWEQFYVGLVKLDPKTSTPAAFKHFIERGVARGIAPNPMFDQALYLKQIEDLDLPPVESGRSVFLHWLTIGQPAGVVPTRLFDEDEYRVASGVQVPKGAYFAHYLRLGYRRNFSPSQFFDARWYARFYKLGPDELSIIDYALSGEAKGRSPHPWIAALRPQTKPGRMSLNLLADTLHARCAKLASPELKEQITKAAAIEPRVMRPLERRIITYPPFKHGASRLWAAGVAMRKSLSRTHYDALVIAPHCRMAGSARVAGALAAALQRIDPQSSTLLVTTELPDFERPDWFPAGVEILNLPELLGPRRTDQVDLLLLDLVQGLKPTKVFNVNSLSGWKFLARYGRQLIADIALFSYVFTWEIDALGVKVGYPVVELQRCIDTLDACFVDNQALADELAWRYSLSPTAAAEKLAVLWSPTPTSPVDLSENFVRRGKAREPMRCMWAGRFDRQKRLDLALQIAVLMPALTVEVFGKPVLADGAVLPKTFPGNIELKGVYEDLDAVGLERFDFFFYTSAWDGVPTVLLDMAARGVPILASAVGGVGDLIDEETGWLVTDWENPAAYVARIEEMTANPEEVAARSRRLKARVAERHSDERFDRDLKASLDRRERARAEAAAKTEVEPGAEAPVQAVADARAPIDAPLDVVEQQTP